MLFDREGRLVSTAEERADQERQRAETAEAQIAHLRAQLGEPLGPAL